MQILSYRGPSAPGGVSNALTQIFENNDHFNKWWFVRDNFLKSKARRTQDSAFKLDPNLKRNHYRYCNNFLWPVLHDLPQFARYSTYERLSYNTFNAITASYLLSGRNKYQDSCFVNDYQFALIPKLIEQSFESFVFWHIPWPKHVLPQHVDPLKELAEGLLHSRLIGFHTSEYKENFFRFVEKHLLEFEIFEDEELIFRSNTRTREKLQTRIVVAPLGVDLNGWQSLSKNSSYVPPSTVPFILSVDRADYTKGIYERIEAIETFFSRYPHWQERISFLQHGTRSRQGLPEFDSYWNNCQKKYKALNLLRSTQNWQPIVWSDRSYTGEELSSLYKQASVMLVSPVRDGLNLTAKEFIASRSANPGILALSPGAGVWTELGADCVAIDPLDKIGFADSIARCLEMSETEKLNRTLSLQNKLSKNTLSHWWNSFYQDCRASQSDAVLEKICS